MTIVEVAIGMTITMDGIEVACPPLAMSIDGEASLLSFSRTPLMSSERSPPPRARSNGDLGVSSVLLHLKRDTDSPFGQPEREKLDQARKVQDVRRAAIVSR